MSKRLGKELASLQKSPVAGAEISLASDDDLTQWTIILDGPKSTPYANGKFEVCFAFPENYPFKPPEILFKTKIYHPNIKTDTGEICNDVINEGWGPTMNVRHCINTLNEMLENPNADSPVEESIATMLREKPKEFEKTAKKWTKDHASA